MMVLSYRYTGALLKQDVDDATNAPHLKFLISAREVLQVTLTSTFASIKLITRIARSTTAPLLVDASLIPQKHCVSRQKSSSAPMMPRWPSSLNPSSDSTS